MNSDDFNNQEHPGWLEGTDYNSYNIVNDNARSPIRRESEEMDSILPLRTMTAAAATSKSTIIDESNGNQIKRRRRSRRLSSNMNQESSSIILNNDNNNLCYGNNNNDMDILQQQEKVDAKAVIVKKTLSSDRFSFYRLRNESPVIDFQEDNTFYDSKIRTSNKGKSKNKNNTRKNNIISSHLHDIVESVIDNDDSFNDDNETAMRNNQFAATTTRSMNKQLQQDCCPKIPNRKKSLSLESMIDGSSMSISESELDLCK